jgi:hypothetical protein
MRILLAHHYHAAAPPSQVIAKNAMVESTKWPDIIYTKAADSRPRPLLKPNHHTIVIKMGVTREI